MTLSATLESALIGQATAQDVIQAIDEELTGKATVLVDKAYKAAHEAMKQADKPSKSLPVTSYILVTAYYGQMNFTPFAWEKRDEKTQTIPARVESDFSICVPAKQFTAWLKASQLTTEEKRKGASSQVNFTVTGTTLTMTIGNSRSVFYGISADEFPA